ncbi:MAG: DUF1080 domain-containing protein [Acidobacteria bacterium]|nr:DUF1080 domain-containing protein [Acidobacteriota bacterium]
MRITILLLLSCAVWAQTPKKKGTQASDDQKGYTDTPLIPGQQWRVHDAARARPVKVAPGRPLAGIPAPADADVLFDGTDLSKWIIKSRAGEIAPPNWKVENGYVEIVSPAGMRWNLVTKDKYGDCQLHLEWMIPEHVNGRGQGGGNSGVELMSRYEIQVLESWENLTYADGQAAALYGQWPPMVNASARKGDWNSYDIFFEAPRFNGETLVKPGYITVVHNGVLVHHRREILGPAAHRRNAPYRAHEREEPLSLQDHGHPVRYRNIWIRRLKETP